jgi:hypothetical protein
VVLLVQREDVRRAGGLDELVVHHPHLPRHSAQEALCVRIEELDRRRIECLLGALLLLG